MTPAPSLPRETPLERGVLLVIGVFLLALLLAMARILAGNWRSVVGPIAGAGLVTGIVVAIEAQLRRRGRAIPSVWLWVGPPVFWGAVGLVWDGLAPVPGQRAAHAISLAGTGALLAVFNWIGRRRRARSVPPVA